MIFNKFQYGFRKQKRTVDCEFILQSIINQTIINDERKLYAAFIDFRKAFDLVYRDGIWFKLINYGTSSTMIEIEKNGEYCFAISYS